MPFQPTNLGSQIRSTKQDLSRQQGAVPTPEMGGAAQKAKESALTWVRSGMRDANRDSNAPWFSGVQPFTELRMQAPQQFDYWRMKFTGATNMGMNFAPPPPMPEPGPAAETKEAK
jgi:hypothetical protein